LLLCAAVGDTVSHELKSFVAVLAHKLRGWPALVRHCTCDAVWYAYILIHT